MRNCFVLFERSHDRAVDQLFDACRCEVFEETDAFFNEGSRVHDQCPLELSNVLRGPPADILDFSLILKRRSRPSLSRIWSTERRAECEKRPRRRHLFPLYGRTVPPARG